MAYSEHFKLADDYIDHVNEVVGGLSDPFLRQRYVGFVAISAVTVYELAVKDIFIGFASQKHRAFGTMVENLYDRLNGRVSLGDIRKLHVSYFGDKYLKRFDKKLQEAEVQSLRERGRSIRSSYGNIITWRNVFVHQGRVPQNANYNEAVQAYDDGKAVIHSLAEIMRR